MAKKPFPFSVCKECCDTGSGGSGGEITIDAEMSDTSENPVQNKVVKSYIDGTVNDINNQISNLNEYDQELFNMIDEANSQISNINTSMGNIDSALDELHNYAQGLIGGDS